MSGHKELKCNERTKEVSYYLSECIVIGFVEGIMMLEMWILVVGFYLLS